jgi:hypothetical protein
MFKRFVEISYARLSPKIIRQFQFTVYPSSRFTRQVFGNGLYFHVQVDRR